MANVVKGPFGFIHNGKTEAQLIALRDSLVAEADKNGKTVTSVSVNGSSSSFTLEAGRRTVQERLLEVDYALWLSNPDVWPAPVDQTKAVFR